jgi:LysR family glycine cleavage system transcriptional activator
VLVDAHRSLPLWSYWRAAAPPGVEPRWGDARVLGTVAAVRWLVLRGRGVAVLPRYLVAPDLRARRLRALLPSVTPRSDHFRLLFRRDDPRRGAFEAIATALRAIPLR